MKLSWLRNSFRKRLEAFAAGIFPWTARRDVGGGKTALLDPSPDRGRDEPGPLSLRINSGAPHCLTAASSTAITSWASHRVRHFQSHTLAAALIADRQPFESATILGFLKDEVVTPDLVHVRRSAPAGGVGRSGRAVPLALPPGPFQTFLPPESLDALGVDFPACPPQVRRRHGGSRHVAAVARGGRARPPRVRPARRCPR